MGTDPLVAAAAVPDRTDLWASAGDGLNLYSSIEKQICVGLRESGAVRRPETIPFRLYIH